MLKVTIKNSECQDFFGERNNSVESSVKSYYRRKDISLSVRTEISLNLLEQEGQYGVVTPLATAYGVSRTFLYNLRETARGALEMALTCGQPGRPRLSSTIEVDGNRLKRGIVTLAAVGGCSIFLSVSTRTFGMGVETDKTIEQTQRVLSELLSVSCSVGYISEVLKSAEERAEKANAALVPCREVTLAADEIFDGASPHLVLVEPSSLLCEDWFTS